MRTTAAEVYLEFHCWFIEAAKVCLRFYRVRAQVARISLPMRRDPNVNLSNNKCKVCFSTTFFNKFLAPILFLTSLFTCFTAFEGAFDSCNVSETFFKRIFFWKPFSNLP